MSSPAMFDLTGRIAVVTGGNGGIGLGIAIGLAEAGASVAILARDEEKNRAALSSFPISPVRLREFRRSRHRAPQGGGPVEFHDLIRNWRADGQMKGLLVQ